MKKNVNCTITRVRGSGKKVGSFSAARGEVLYKGSLAQTVVLAAGTNVVGLNVALLTDLSSLSDTFKLYRFEELDFTFYPTSFEGTPIDYSVSYYNEVADAAPSLTENLYQPYSKFVSNVFTVPTKLHVPKSFLVGDNAMKFWDTRNSTNVSVWDENQGQIRFVAGGSATSSITFVMKYTLRLVDAVIGGLTPAPQRRSLVPESRVNDAYIDLYMPGHPHAYPPSRNLKEDWVRVTANWFRAQKFLTASDLRKLTEADPDIKTAQLQKKEQP